MTADASQPKLRFIPTPDWMPKEPQTSDVHSHLYHYTNISSLRSIIKTNEMWATYFRHLNDYTELFLFKTELNKRLPKMLLNRLLEIVKVKPFLRIEAGKRYGSIRAGANIESTAFIDLLYKTAFGAEDTEDSFYPIFILSFCTHDSDTPYEQENGLLSQWRSYGKDGGVAIVFRTLDLEKSFQYEHDAYLYNFVGLGSAIYSHRSEEIEKFLQPITDEIGRELLRMYSDEKSQLQDIFGPFIAAASRFKHQAFFEEREVRLYASPTPLHVISKEQNNEALFGKRAKSIHPNLAGKKRIKLFGQECPKAIPIEMIIVGPSSEQEKHYQEVQLIVSGTNIKVQKSKTPYLEQSRMNKT